MSIEIRFVGGPADGQTFAIIDEVPPPRYLIPLAPSLADLLTDPSELTPKSMSIPVAEYEPLYENGWPSRAGDGACLYRHRVSPVSLEERVRLEQARRDARVARERREAELEETWREIRRERPHYPADWRDL